jgi:hypothetical protein
MQPLEPAFLLLLGGKELPARGGVPGAMPLLLLLLPALSEFVPQLLPPPEPPLPSFTQAAT